MNKNDTHPFETNLDRHPSNYIPLSPVSFLTRAASAFADKVAVIDGARRYTFAQLLDRCVRFASALAQLGVKRLDTVAIIASNIPEMIEAHFAVPMLGAVLNPLNTRLDAANVAFSLMHGNAKVLIVDMEYSIFPLSRGFFSGGSCRRWRNASLSSQSRACTDLPTDRGASGPPSLWRSDRTEYAGSRARRSESTGPAHGDDCNRWRGAALRRLPVHGSPRLPGYSSLWGHRNLRARDPLRLPARMER